MKLLKTIYETDIGLKSKKLNINYEIREAARVVIFNKKNEVAIIHVANVGFHTLPGGGLKDNEDTKEALKREVLEETGYEIKNVKELGKIISYRNNDKVIQTDFGYIAKTARKIKEPQYSKGEIKDGMVLEWCDLDTAIELLQKEKSSDYTKKYKIFRDLEFLKKVS